MNSHLRAFALLLIAAGLLPAQTAGVQNAASSPGYPGFGYANFRLGAPASSNIVAPGMLAVLSFSPIVTTLSGAALLLPVTVSIRPSGSATPIRADVVSFNRGSVTFVVPRNMPLGGAEIEYEPAGQPTAWTNVTVVPASFDFYRNGAGGPAIAQAVAQNGSLTPIGLTTPAQPGQTIRLTGTGLGNSTFGVTVGGVPATIVHAQPHRAQPGLDEILIQMPSAVPDGCYVPIALTYDKTTIGSTISKTSTGAPCAHPFQLSVADMKTLDSGGVLNTGLIDMDTTLNVATATAASRDESASVSVSQMTVAGIASYLAPVSGQGCTINQASGEFAYAGFLPNLNSSVPIPNLGQSVYLQNGTTTLNLTGGPDYFSATLPQPTEGALTSPPAPVIAGGNWTWKSTGSTDLAASSFTFTLPGPFQLNGTAPLSLTRNADQTITWDGAAWDSGAVLNASLYENDTANTVSLTCRVPASSGTLSIPAALLNQFSPNSLATLQLSISESGSSIPHAQLKLQNGNTLLMLVNYQTIESLPVDLQ